MGGATHGRGSDTLSAAMLRDVTLADLERFFDHQNEPEGARMAAFAPRARDAFMTHWRDNVLGSPENVAKTVAVDDEVVGNVLAFSIEGRRFVGYWIGMAYAGRGFATAALAELLRDFETTRPVFAHVALTNPASLRVLEKCGFLPEGDAELGEDGVEERTMRLDAAEPAPLR